jgi:hypothetical protein
VAELAARWRHHQQIAVEFHLTRAYRKLELVSRRELAPLFEAPHDVGT